MTISRRDTVKRRPSPAPASATLVEGDIRDTARVAAILKEHAIESVMHFAAWLSVGDSVHNPAGYYHNNVIGALSVLEAMVTQRRETTRVLLDVRGVRQSHSNADRRRSSPPPDQCLWRNQVRPSSGRCRTTSAPTDSDRSRSGISMPPAPTPTASSARTTSRRFTLFHGPLTPRAAEPPSRFSARTTRRPTAHVCATTCTSSDLSAAHLLALEALDRGASSTAYNLGTGRPTSVREILQSVERVTGRAVPYTIGPRREGDPAILYATSARIRRDLGWAPQYEDIDAIVGTAWRWRQRHPQGYASR